jgi:hypothetical protein
LCCPVVSGLERGLIPRPRSPNYCVYDPWFQINSGGKEAREPNMKSIKKKKKKKKKQKSKK